MICVTCKKDLAAILFPFIVTFQKITLNNYKEIIEQDLTFSAVCSFWISLKSSLRKSNWMVLVTLKSLGLTWSWKNRFEVWDFWRDWKGFEVQFWCRKTWIRMSSKFTLTSSKFNLHINIWVQSSPSTPNKLSHLILLEKVHGEGIFVFHGNKNGEFVQQIWTIP